jgi:hypothetical protein
MLTGKIAISLDVSKVIMKDKPQISNDRVVFFEFDNYLRVAIRL